jgi:hypothetical protein
LLAAAVLLDVNVSPAAAVILEDTAMAMAPINDGLEEATNGLEAVEEEKTINLLDEDAMVTGMLCSLDKRNEEMSYDDVDIFDDLYN